MPIRGYRPFLRLENSYEQSGLNIQYSLIRMSAAGLSSSRIVCVMAEWKQQIVVVWMSSVLCQREKYQIHSESDQIEQSKEF